MMTNPWANETLDRGDAGGHSCKHEYAPDDPWSQVKAAPYWVPHPPHAEAAEGVAFAAVGPVAVAVEVEAFA
jgi:hypothetical protein